MDRATKWKIALAVVSVAVILWVIAECADNRQQPAQSAVPVVCKPYFAATAIFFAAGREYPGDAVRSSEHPVVGSRSWVRGVPVSVFVSPVGGGESRLF